ncbi:hypothetical protein PMAYCL1PPCAC_00183, partial [Pristionchus mayeri]
EEEEDEDEEKKKGEKKYEGVKEVKVKMAKSKKHRLRYREQGGTFISAADARGLQEVEFLAPIEDEYVAKLAATTPEDIFPSPNPGPSNPDGTVNFECHCVGHLVASPRGWEFREAISCQK